MIDLHMHTKASDGDLLFEQLVAEAAKAGLRAIAITDHDTTKSAMEITGKEPLEVIPGIELSVFDHGLGYLDVHMLGLFIDPAHPSLLSKFKVLKKQREGQKKEMISKIASLGYDITFEEVLARASGSVGRPHIAQVLAEKYPGDFPSFKSVFDKLIANGKPAYVDRKDDLSIREAVRLIHDAGGLSFLAHPFLYGYDLNKLVGDFRREGGDGIEVYYDYESNIDRRIVSEHDRPDHFRNIMLSENFSNRFMFEKGSALASRFGLLECGGSDFHGPSMNQKPGRFGAPDEVLERLKRELKT